MIATEIITDYERLTHAVTDIINASGYKIDYVCEKMGLTRIGFYKKRKTGTFKPDELKKLFQIIDHGNLEDKLLGKILEQADKTDILNEEDTKKFFKKRK